MTVTITEYYWGGKKFFYKIKTHCKECDITKAMIESVLNKELKGKDVRFEFKPWLNSIFYCLFRGTWHAPILMINGKKFHQFSEEDPFFNREKLVQTVLQKLEKNR